MPYTTLCSISAPDEVLLFTDAGLGEVAFVVPGGQLAKSLVARSPRPVSVAYDPYNQV